MKEHNRILLFKLIALTGCFSFIYAPVLLGRTYLFGGGNLPYNLIFEFAVIMLGFFLAYFTIGNSISIKRRIFAYLTVIIPSAVAFLIYRGGSTLSGAYELAAAFVFYIIGIHANSQSFEAIIGKGRVLTGIVFVAASMLAVYYENSLKTLKMPVSIFAYVFTISFMLVMNQEGLDNVFIRKGMKTYEIPKNIRSYNIIIVSVFFLIVILLLNFKGAMILLFKLAGSIIKIVFWLIFKLTSLLPISSTKSDTTQQQTQQQFLGGGSSNSPFLDFLLNVAEYFLLFYITYKVLPMVIRKIVKELKKAFMYIRSRFNLVGSDSSNASEDYNDTIEIIRPQKVNAGRFTARKMRNIRRNLKQITDPVQKVRYIYSVVISMLPAMKVQLSRADTTGEIYRKASDISEVREPLGQLTNVYDRVRYGDAIPDENDMNRVDESYNVLSGIGKSKGKR